MARLRRRLASLSVATRACKLWAMGENTDEIRRPAENLVRGIKDFLYETLRLIVGNPRNSLTHIFHDPSLSVGVHDPFRNPIG